MIEILVDADACPVKDEIYVVATRYGVPVVLVANSRCFVPQGFGVELVVVEQGLDVADDWIVDHTRQGDVVVTGDIPLAARCLQLGAFVLGNTGRVFDENSIGGQLAIRELKQELRETGSLSGGPPAMSDRKRSLFSSKLDEIVNKSLREHATT